MKDFVIFPIFLFDLWLNICSLNSVFSSMIVCALPLVDVVMLVLMQMCNFLIELIFLFKILTYDWSEGGDTEVVVEDVERLQLEYFDKYDKQQSDWRMHR